MKRERSGWVGRAERFVATVASALVGWVVVVGAVRFGGQYLISGALTTPLWWWTWYPAGVLGGVAVGTVLILRAAAAWPEVLATSLALVAVYARANRFDHHITLTVSATFLVGLCLTLGLSAWVRRRKAARIESASEG